MPRLKEFLQWLASPGHEHIWVILDIKLLLPTFWQALFNNRAVLDRLDRYADDLFHAISVTLAGVQPAPGRPWRERVTVGCWAVSFLFTVSCQPLDTYYYYWLETSTDWHSPGKIPPALLRAPGGLSNHTHRVQRRLRAAFPASAQRKRQPVSVDCRRPTQRLSLAWNAPEEAGPRHPLLDRQPGVIYEMVYTPAGRRRDYGRSQAVSGGV